MGFRKNFYGFKVWLKIIENVWTSHFCLISNKNERFLNVSLSLNGQFVRNDIYGDMTDNHHNGTKPTARLETHLWCIKSHMPVQIQVNLEPVAS